MSISQDTEPKDVRELLMKRGPEAVRERVMNGQRYDPTEDAEEDDDHAEPVVETINGLPAIELPCPGRPIGDFAGDLGRTLAHAGVYSRGGLAFTVDPGGQKLVAVDPQWLRTWAETELSLFKSSRTREGEVIRLRHTMALDAAKAVVVAPQFLDELPPIRRFLPVRMPTLRNDGGPLELLPLGFDAESGTLTDPDGCPFPLDMTPDQGKREIDAALAEFPFPDERSKAAAVSSMVTVFGTLMLPAGSTIPCFIYLANAAGAGKTNLAKLAGIPYGTVAAKTAPKDEAEWCKRLLSLVMSGQRLLVLDNVKGHLNSPSLEAYLTATKYGDRILGVSKEFEGEADAVVLITGNRLTVTEDLRRRSIFVELFMTELRAEDRKFKRWLDDPAMLELQPQLLGALWAIVRGWDDAGRPPASRINASFPRWSEIIGGIVEHAGFGCPTATPELEDGGDTDTADVMALGRAMDHGEPLTFAELCSRCADLGLFERFTADTEDGELTRKAKAGFARLLKTYHGRTIAEGKTFVASGKGKSRRFEVR